MHNGRYAEAEEAFTAVQADASKQPGRLTPALKVAIALGLAECQASQGEYAKAIEILKAAEADDPRTPTCRRGWPSCTSPAATGMPPRPR